MKKQSPKIKGGGGIFWSVLLLAAFFSFSEGSAGAVTNGDENLVKTAGSRHVRVQVQDGRLLVQAEECNLHRLIKEVEDKTGIEFEVDPGLNGKVSVSIDEHSIEAGIKRLTAVVCENSVVYYVPDEHGQGATTISRVILFGNQGTVSSFDGRPPRKDITEVELSKAADSDEKGLSHNPHEKDALKWSAVMKDAEADRAQRIAAAAHLIKLGGAEAVDEIAAEIRETKDAELAYGLTRQLGLAKCPESVQVLSSIREESLDPVLRYKAVQAMGAMKNEDAIDSLQRAAREDPDKYNRARAITALGNIGKKEMIPYFKQLQQEESDEFVNRVCQKMIMQLQPEE